MERKFIYHNGEWIEKDVDEIIEKAAKEGRLLYHNGKIVENSIFNGDCDKIEDIYSETGESNVYTINLFEINEKELLNLLKRIEGKLNSYFFNDGIIKEYATTRDPKIEDEAMTRVNFYFYNEMKGVKIVEDVIKKRIKKKPSLRKYGIDKIKEELWGYYMLCEHDCFPYLKPLKDYIFETLEEEMLQRKLEEMEEYDEI